MSNPFHGSLEDNFRGRRVRVVSNDGEAYEGWVERLHHHDRHVVLRDATRLDGDVDVGAVMVAHADTIEVLNPSSRIETVAVDTVEPSPYHAADFELAANRGYVSDVRDREFVGSFPVARERDDGTLEVVAGHKRLWVCRQADVDEHPVEIVDLDEWDAARRFIADHIPHEEQVHDGGTADGYYADQEIRAAVDALVERWGDRVLTVDRIAFNVERLNIVVNDNGEAEDAGDADDEPNREGPDDTAEEAYACAVDGCGYTTDSKRGLTIHHGKLHEEEDDQTVEERITTVLNEHEELPAKEIGLLLETSSDHYYNVLAKMKRDDRVASRRDPDDRRRHLYRLATEGEEDSIDERDESGETEAVEEDSNEDNEIDEDDGGSSDAKDDGDGDGSGDNESDWTLPYECCGETIDDTLEWIVHRTEEHGASRTELDNLEPGEFEATVRESDSLWDLTDKFSWGIQKSLKLLGIYDLADEFGFGDEGVEETVATADGGDATNTGGDAAAATDEADQTPPIGQSANEPDDDSEDPALDLSEYGVGRDELVNAITDSQTVHHVQRELRVDRETTTKLLDATGLLEQLGAGCAPIQPRDAERAVQEMSHLRSQPPHNGTTIGDSDD